MDRKMRIAVVGAGLGGMTAAGFLQRAGFAGGVEADNTPELREIQVTSTTDYDECLACQ